ncbi:MAG: hypothetical protein KDD25_08175, partial [Bdellovibrionales bacterium]|nr:hypothetical protein [Bdellovibrionales bacterium]
MKTEKSFSKKILAVIFTLVVQAFSPQSDAQFGPPSSKLAEAHLKEGVRKLFSPDRLEAGERNAKEHSRIRSCLDPHLAAFPEYNCSKEEIQRTQRNCALKD